MYGKLFQSTFTGSMMGAGTVVFSVWAYAVAHCHKGQVELNPALLAAILGTDVLNIEKAIEYLCAPDPHSRSPEHEGRRLIKEGQFAYYMPTHAKYRAIRNDEDRREYNRQAKAKERARKAGKGTVSKDVKASVNDSQRLSKMSAHTEAEAEADTEAKRERLPCEQVLADVSKCSLPSPSPSPAGARSQVFAEPALPTLAEVVSYGDMHGIPKEFSERYHAVCTEKHRWLVPSPTGVKLLGWQSEMARWWKKDRQNWKPNGEEPTRSEDDWKKWL